ncbi:MAG: quinone oxidoreductase [Candidatus Korobacteraceae bacterium]
MKAIQIKECGGPEVMAVVDLPVPKPKANEALVKIKAAGVNYADVYVREGMYRPTLPTVLGQEAAGTVTEVGAEVTTVKPGDRVAYRGAMGSYAEYAAVPAALLVRIPEGISEEQAAAAMLQGMTAHYLLYSTYPVKRGETVLIHAAAGGVGLLLVQMAHHIGARVIGTVSTEEKAKLAREAGADEVIIYTKTDFEAETKRIMNNKGVDVIYDSVGKATFEKGLNLLRPRGYMVNFGAASGPPAPLDLSVLTAKGSLFVTRPSLQHYAATRQETEERSAAIFGMIKSGKLKLRIERRYPLDQAIQAHRDIQSRKTTGKLLLIP